MADKTVVKAAKPPKVHISLDGLVATIRLSKEPPGTPKEKYVPALMMQLLTDAGVTFGIDRDAVKDLCDRPVYDRDIVIATGRKAEQGQDGYFEYHFDLTTSKKPTIRPDGTSDYMNIKSMEIVHKDDVIITYHKAVPGHQGMSVRGNVIEPKPARDVPPIQGRGFTRSNDNLTYTALIDGKITKNGNRIFVTNVHEISTDADISTGNIDFYGDVIVHGGACDGVVIKATGDVTIDGLVESCEIYAGGDIILKAGIKGNERTKIKSKANITTEFIEYADLECAGDLVADYIFNSKVVCEGKIDLSGEKSTIIGGSVYGIQGIMAKEIGNEFGTNTIVNVGIRKDKMIAIDALSRKIKKVKADMVKIKEGLEAFEKLGKERGLDYSDDPRRLQLLRVKIRDEASIQEDENTLANMKAVVERGKNAKIKAFKKVYPGVVVGIDNNMISVSEEQFCVEFRKSSSGIRMERVD